MADVDGYNIHQAPDWSHDGKRRLFDAIDANGRFDFFAANRDGSGRRKPGSGLSPTGRPAAADGPSPMEICVVSDPRIICYLGRDIGQ